MPKSRKHLERMRLNEIFVNNANPKMREDSLERREQTFKNKNRGLDNLRASCKL